MFISNGIRLPLLNHFNVPFACITIRSIILSPTFSFNSLNAMVLYFVCHTIGWLHLYGVGFPENTCSPPFENINGRYFNLLFGHLSFLKRQKANCRDKHIRKYQRISGKKDFNLMFRMFQHTSSEVINRRITTEIQVHLLRI